MSESELILKGIPICHGVAIGKPFLFHITDHQFVNHNNASNFSIDKEILLYYKALQDCRRDFLTLKTQLDQTGAKEGVAILEAQLEMMQDPLFLSEVETEITASGKNAETCLNKIIVNYQRKFNAMQDPFFRERFNDIQDIAKRVINYLRACGRVSLANLPPNAIVFSRDLSASETAEANIARAGALVTELGGLGSHAAIVAKARGTPYVSNIAFSQINPEKHHTVIVDGRTGDIILNPNPDTLTKYNKLYKRIQAQVRKLHKINALTPETYDGYSLKVSANVESAHELECLHIYGGHGVGLYRTEYIIMKNAKFPTEEEQVVIYREIVRNMKGAPIVMRTFDIGGDKPFPNQPQELNPFLGCRAIRFLLKEREIFYAQLRAILRVAEEGNVKIMFPLISTLSELREAKRALQDAREQLRGRRIPYGNVQVGCMIEVPSAVVISDLLAKESDFLSIGTNDLVQYSLAVDRSNHAMSGLYSPMHPSILRMIKTVTYEANKHGIPVSVCGEIAADPHFTALLIGLGIHELSVSTRYIPLVKHTVRHTSVLYACELAESVMKLTSSAEVQEFLSNEYKRQVPPDDTLLI